MKKVKNTWLLTGSGLLSIFCFYITWCLTTISYQMNISVFYCLFVLLTGFFYLCIQRLILSDSVLYQKLYGQFVRINSGFLIIGCIIYFTMLKERLTQKEYLYVGGYFFWLLILAITEYKLVKDKVNKELYDSTISFIKEHKYLFILLVIAGLLAPDYHGIQFKWDGLLYYITCQGLSLDSISSLAIYGHIAQTFGAMVQMGTQLFGNVAFSMAFSNILLLLTSSCAFYGTLKILVPDKKDIMYTLGTAVYAFSPFLLGMVNYYNLDYYCLCFSTFVFYYGCKKQWLSFFVFGLLFCFTKEPAIIIYGSYCVGIVIVEFIQDKEKQLGKRICNIFKHSKYYMMILPGVLWLVTYMILGPWSAGNSEMRIDLSYVVDKLKVLYLFNFNWIYTAIVVVGVIGILVRGKETWMDNLWLLPLCISQLGFTIFSCILKTVNHPRYSDSSPVFLCLVSVVILLKFIERKHLQRSILIALACLMLESSFYTLDPVTRTIFENVNIGKTTMVVPQPEAPGDGMIYNKQMLYLERALELALTDAIDDEECIVFPAIDQSTYYFDGMAEVRTLNRDEFSIETQWWDAANKKRSVSSIENSREITIAHIGGEEGLKKLLEEYDGEIEKVSFFYLPFAGEEMAEIVRNQYMVIDEEEFTANGWKINKITFTD